MLKLYHAPQSRSSRIIWLLEEVGEPYEIEYVSIRRADGSGERDPKNPHPDGKVPALVHDGMLVTESGAICLYLSDAFPAAGLGPGVGDPGRADYLTWLFFYAAEVEPALIAKATGRVDSDEREARAYDRAMGQFEAALERGPYILGDAFSCVDVLFGGMAARGAVLLPERDVFKAYAERMSARPAFQRAPAREDP